ncbi:TPA: folate-binding protein YgfZ [Neisseria meningitidis]|uniref:CAF17-like 4Fe-4S cluster assembly/insertion protein YgfZ n=1 Tax=Neisseria meningitidis TaxID=487 RepID=UPI0002A4FDC1|nr:folate-binding protein YgfZ [Neisseria meningitidis]ELK58309.1 aminomethyltransferase folate-binding domain protein [Neisseria meningitidis 87255]MBH2266653.1 folate-binding protein YgfZ [Neisseria meningitidis]MBH2281656.1 folate-binding protein YgfZ [Neisseria meningitidis]MBH2354129.1 folate-binding protein YgfZ [Neisseria meningitidis]MBH2410658.1 folate-binding protein YgfZ [Neisseria meningitidis]
MKTLLPFFGVVRVSGEDRQTFLHGQLSNDINHLQTGRACYATYNTPKGRVIANMIVVNRGGDLLLIMAQDLLEATVKRLRMFVLRAKAVFEILEDYAVGAELEASAEPLAAQEPNLAFATQQDSDGICSIALPHGGILRIAPETALPPYDAAAESAWRLHEIRSGYPWICAATKETAVAQMLNQHIIGGVHFKKGCYPGQEIIARAQYRGQVKRGLAVLSGNSAVEAGTLLTADGEEAGIVLDSVQDSENFTALTVIKFSAAQKELTAPNGSIFKAVHPFFKTENAE